MPSDYYYPGDTDPAGAGGGGMGDGGGIAGAVLNVGAGLYDSYQNRKQSKWNTMQTIRAQKAESELAYQRSVQMWNMQNAYNTPQAQMERFVKGGLNPHLIYGQGSSGNASSYPEYRPADLEYNVEPARYGSAVQSILPTLMAVGTWMQNMRMSEVQIEKGSTDTERLKQLMDYLQQANPETLGILKERLGTMGYQKSSAMYGRDIARQKLYEFEQEFRHKFGDSLFYNMGSNFADAYTGSESKPPIGGMRKLQYLEQASKTKLADAKASWSDFNITDPQAIIQLVLSGVMGMAGMTLRGGKSPAKAPVKRPTGVRRVHPSRRVQSAKRTGYWD